MSLHKEYVGLLPQEVIEELTGLKQLMKMSLLRNSKYTIGSKKLKMTINQGIVEIHQRNHQVEAPRNHQVLQRPSHQEALLEKYQ